MISFVSLSLSFFLSLTHTECMVQEKESEEGKLLGAREEEEEEEEARRSCMSILPLFDEQSS